MTAYYNEVSTHAAGWLRRLISAGLIPAGDVDDRSICDVQPGDLAGYTQCHFFAGLGGWAYGARLAGWPDDRPIWTGSCPCQPWSRAGRAEGATSEKHLWPAWFRLIRAARPAIVMGEQVPTAAGRGWWDEVADDLEGDGYACRALIVPASGVGAPHKRERLWFVADAPSQRDGVAPWQVPARRNIPEHSPWWAAEPDLDRVAHGVPGRVDQMRALGNAIVPQVAAELIGAYADLNP